MSEGKSFPEMLAGKLMPNPISNVPWTDISVDFIMGLPEAQGYDAILCVCTDSQNKFILFLLRRRQFSRVGAPLLRSRMEITWIP